MKLIENGKVKVAGTVTRVLTGHRCDTISFDGADMYALYAMGAEDLKERIGHLCTRFKHFL